VTPPVETRESPQPAAQAATRAATDTLTTGVPALDELIDGVRVGDNLVILADRKEVLGYIARAFLEAAGRLPIVIAATEDESIGMAPDSAVVLDHRESTASVQPLLDSLRTADEQTGPGAAFLVDSLTAVQQRWGAASALELFLTVCPHLYRRGSVAMWLLEAPEHDDAFLDRLQEITQVVVHLTGDEPNLEAVVLTAAGRPPTTPGRRLQVRAEDGQLVAAGAVRPAHDRLGDLVRSQRLLQGVSQSELARRVGISPSAISQVERGVRGIGGATLMRVWETLGVPFGPDDTLQRGYRIGRRSGHRQAELAAGATGSQFADDVSVGQCWRISFEPGARGDRPLFAGRVRETIILDRGVLEVEVGGHHEVLHEGDSLVAPRAPIQTWHNPGTAAAIATWWVLA
jgi:transcriptional regulator with XRE-family HTH domain